MYSLPGARGGLYGLLIRRRKLLSENNVKEHGANTSFVDRMRGLAGTKLQSFAESALGIEFESSATSPLRWPVAKSQRTMPDVNRSVEMMLLVKDAGAWRIVGLGRGKSGESDSFRSHKLGG
jgi:hypothetical protein